MIFYALAVYLIIFGYGKGIINLPLNPFFLNSILVPDEYAKKKLKDNQIYSIFL